MRKVFHSGKRAPAKVKDKKGNLLESCTDRVHRWREHFQNLLNVDAPLNEDMLPQIKRLHVQNVLAELPIFAETLAAVKSLKKGKAAGPDGLPAEVLQVLSYPVLRSLHEHLCQLWLGCQDIPGGWNDAYLIPMPKKGDLADCANCRGILLNAVPGKVLAKIINGRLVKHFEGHQAIPESQCGFRAGRGTTDMIFTLRMAIELARAKHLPLYVLFVDLMKAYDPVSRFGLWEILQYKGVPPTLASLIKNFYQGKTARVSVEGTLSSPFDLATGLGQGCCLAPLLFNVFLSAVMESWETCTPPKLEFKYRIDGILRRHMDEQSLNKYTTWHSLQLHDLGYADDAAFITDTYDKLVQLARDLQNHYFQWGLTMSVEKTELFLTEGETPDPISVKEVGGFSKLKFADKFKYLGSHIEHKQGCVQEIQYRIDKARKASWSLASHVWDVKQISLAVKLQVYRACVLSVLLYGAESWTTTFLCRRRLEVFHMKCLRKSTKIGILDQEQLHINNQELRARLGVPTIRQLVSQARLRWLGHLARMAPERLPKQMLFAFLPGDVGAPTKPGRRTGKWLSFDFVNDLELVAVPKLEWLHMARKNGGANWKQIVFQAAPWHQPKNPFKPLPELGQAAAKSKNLRPHEPRAAFWQLVQRQQAVLQEAKVSSGFLSMELKHGGETTFRKAVATWLDTNGPDKWARQMVGH